MPRGSVYIDPPTSEANDRQFNIMARLILSRVLHINFMLQQGD